MGYHRDSIEFNVKYSMEFYATWENARKLHGDSMAFTECHGVSMKFSWHSLFSGDFMRSHGVSMENFMCFPRRIP